MTDTQFRSVADAVDTIQTAGREFDYWTHQIDIALRPTPNWMIEARDAAAEQYRDALVYLLTDESA